MCCHRHTEGVKDIMENGKRILEVSANFLAAKCNSYSPNLRRGDGNLRIRHHGQAQRGDFLLGNDFI